MKIELALVPFIWMVCIIMSIAIANDVSFSQVNIPASSYEQHQEGVALAITLSKWIDRGAEKGTLNLYIKNTSNAVKGYSQNEDDSGIQIFYIDTNGSTITLHNGYGVDNRGPRLMEIGLKPGGILHVAVDITSEELALIKTHPVKCSFRIRDIPNWPKYRIESSPRLLTEVAETLPAK